MPAVTVCWGYGGITMVLLLATIGCWLWRWRRPTSLNQEILTRLQSWWIITVFVGLLFFLPITPAIALYGFISFLALKEYLSLIPTRRIDRQVLFWAYLGIALQYYWIATQWYGMFLIFVPLYLFLFLPMRMVLLQETQGFLKAIGTLHWGMMLTVFCLSHGAYLLVLPPPGNPVAGGAGLLLFLILLTELNDIAQFCWGKSLGRLKIIPGVSPNKTLAGLIGGILTTMLLAYGLAPWLTPFNSPHALAIGVLLAFVGFVGDITVSALKRDLGVKDSGNLLPGHGGILDRIDSLTFTAPIFFHFTVYFYYPGLL